MEGASFGYSILILVVMAVLTYGARLFPFVLFSRGGETPKVAVYLGKILPPAVMIVLIVYCVRTVQPTVYPYGLPQLIAGLTVILLYRFTKNNLIAIVGGTILYMVLVQSVFA